MRHARGPWTGSRAAARQCPGAASGASEGGLDVVLAPTGTSRAVADVRLESRTPDPGETPAGAQVPWVPGELVLAAPDVLGTCRVVEDLGASWKERTGAGAMPEFDVVSGVSTGALIAPFAFLGSAQDLAQCENLYRNPKPDWIKARGLK